ncbi:MAG: hypothetical protein K9J22_06115 [Burkholderiaceae bacterium]|nr:hypothetical protein [Burkholderiaceae bacterium]
MNQHIENIAVALDNLAATVKSASAHEAPLNETLGWFAPSITKDELANIASNLAKDIRSIEVQEIDPAINEVVQDLPRRIQSLQASAVAQMFNSNAGQAVPAYIASLSHIRNSLLPSLGWQDIPRSSFLPTTVVKRARAAKATLDQLAPDLEQISSQISEIQEAHKTAENLPIDLEDLSAAKKKIEKTSSDVAITESKLNESKNLAEEHLKAIKTNSAEAEKLVALCEDAYKITTTKGLAAAFDQKASKLNNSIRWWVGGLIIALLASSVIGSKRISMLTQALDIPNPEWGMIIIKSILAVLTIAAPLWFAWLATKQIGQKFRLAEDYEFKASVAKAYEGYRKEAARIDPEFEKQLFGSALKRLEEAPLRLIETKTHGSPFHEFADSHNSISKPSIANKIKTAVATKVNVKKDSSEAENEDSA